MKKLFYILLFSVSTASIAQDPQLFENDWYLYEVMSSDMGTHYDVSNINPPITPYLSISEDLNFNGEGACNTFSGTYEYLPDFLNSINFTSTSDNCNIQQHNSFESEYFGFISGGYMYNITEDSTGKVLTFETPFFGYAIFKSYPLSTSEFQKNKFQIYPNPAKDQLFISATSNPENLKIKIFNIEGKLLSNQTLMLENQTSINVSQLSKGIYFLNIEDDDGGIEVKKFIKE